MTSRIVSPHCSNKASTLASFNLKPFSFFTQCSMQSAYLLLTRAPFQHPGSHAQFIFVIVAPRTRRDLPFFSKLCLDCTLLLLSLLFVTLKTRWRGKDQSGKQEADCTSVCPGLSETNMFQFHDDKSCVLSYLALNASEAGVDLALIQTCLLFSFKCQTVSIRKT